MNRNAQHVFGVLRLFFVQASILAKSQWLFLIKPEERIIDITGGQKKSRRNYYFTKLLRKYFLIQSIN